MLVVGFVQPDGDGPRRNVLKGGLEACRCFMNPSTVDSVWRSDDLDADRSYVSGESGASRRCPDALEKLAGTNVERLIVSDCRAFLLLGLDLRNDDGEGSGLVECLLAGGLNAPASPQ